MKRLSHLLAFAMGGVIAFVVLQSLSACAGGRDARVFLVSSLDNKAERELDRFYDTFSRYSNQPDDDRQRSHFRNAYSLVRSNYVVEVAPERLIDTAIEGVDKLQAKPHSVDSHALVEAALDSMLAGLDPHSGYLNPDEYKESRIAIKGEFGGLGIEVVMDEDGLIKVVSPIEDTPAFRAGIESGDKISHLDGKKIENMTLSDAVGVMRGKPGTDIRLTIVRAGVVPFDVTITRAIIQVRSVRWRLEGDIGYVKITSFNEKVETKLTDAMDAMIGRAKAPLKGIILDLRNNPGGLLDQSLFVADAFLGGGEIVSVRERDPDRDRIYMAEPGDLSGGLPMVVLINEGSASASEIVAGALKDHHRAVIMGRRSFGKGSVQVIQPLPVEGALRLTTARYFAPSGHTIQARGVAPDVVLTRPQPQDADGAKVTIPREADMPGALLGDDMADPDPEATLPRDDCPKAGPDGEDLELGCALAFLHAGSTQAFLGTLAGLPRNAH